MHPVFDARKFSSCITFPSIGIALNAEETEDSVSAERRVRLTLRFDLSGWFCRNASARMASLQSERSQFRLSETK